MVVYWTGSWGPGVVSLTVSIIVTACIPLHVCLVTSKSQIDQPLGIGCHMSFSNNMIRSPLINKEWERTGLARIKAVISAPTAPWATQGHWL